MCQLVRGPIINLQLDITLHNCQPLSSTQGPPSTNIVITSSPGAPHTTFADSQTPFKNTLRDANPTYVICYWYVSCIPGSIDIYGEQSKKDSNSSSNSVLSGLSHILRNRPPIVYSFKLIQITKVRTISDVVCYQYCLTWSLRQLLVYRPTVRSFLHHQKSPISLVLRDLQ